MKNIIINVTIEYRLNGIVLMNATIPSPFNCPVTAAAQLDIGAIMHIGAAVESIMYASFALEILNLSDTGLITDPTVKQLK